MSQIEQQTPTQIRMGALLQIAKEAGAKTYPQAVAWLVRKRLVEVLGDPAMIMLNPNIEIEITRAGARRADGFTGRRPA